MQAGGNAMNLRHKNNLKAVLVGMLIIAISVSLFWFLFDYADKQLKITTQNIVTETTEEHQYEFEILLNAASNDILSLANYIKNTGYNEDFLNEQAIIFGLTNPNYVTEIIPNEYNSFSKSYYQEHQVYMFVPYDDKDIICLGTAIGTGDNKSVVLAEYSVKEFFDRFERTINYADMFIIDANAHVMLSTFTSSNNLFDDISSDGLTQAKILGNLYNQSGGTEIYSSANEDRLVVYLPTNINDWSLMLVANADDVANDIQTLSTVLIVFVMSVFFILMMFLLFFWRSKNEITRLAYFDELTGLPNLAKFKKDITEVLKANPTKSYVTIMVDVNNFKAINEIFDFDIGNQVLKAFSRTIDIVNEKSFIMARTGSDEFIMFSGNGFLENFAQVNSYFETYLKRNVPEIEKHHLSFNYGRYFIELGETDANDIVTKTSLAHSIARTKQDNTIWDYDDNYREQILVLAEITNKMEKALKNNEFVAFLQPKFRLKDNKMIGAEALVRWIEEDGTIGFPNAFIPLFETNGFIVELDKHIFENVCKTLREWLDNGYECVTISVNFSRVNFSDPNFVRNISKIADRYKVPHDLLEIELTETTILDNEEDVEKVIDQLHNAGFSVSIDDFGSGYSSLGMLKNFNVNTLKLDRSFFVNNKEAWRGDLVIDGIIKLAHSINMKIVAEGVEATQQIEFLKRINCQYAQGYFFAKPMPIDEFESNYFK